MYFMSRHFDILYIDRQNYTNVAWHVETWSY